MHARKSALLKRLKKRGRQRGRQDLPMPLRHYTAGIHRRNRRFRLHRCIFCHLFRLVRRYRQGQQYAWSGSDCTQPRGNDRASAGPPIDSSLVFFLAVQSGLLLGAVGQLVQQASSMVQDKRAAFFWQFIEPKTASTLPVFLGSTNSRPRTPAYFAPHGADHASV